MAVLAETRCCGSYRCTAMSPRTAVRSTSVSLTRSATESVVERSRFGAGVAMGHVERDDGRDV